MNIGKIFKLIKGISCGKPEEIKNGVIIKSNEFFYSSVIEYRCISGYRIRNGDYLSECDLDGKWTGRRPICERKSYFIFRVVNK